MTEPTNPVEIIETIEELGIYYLSGEISSESIDPIIKDLLIKKYTGYSQKVTFILNSDGGSLDDTFCLLDVLKFTGFEIETIGLGTVCSSALILLMSGTKGMRKITKDTAMMTHAFSLNMGEYSEYHQLFERRKMEDFIMEKMINIYIGATGLTESVIKNKLLTSTDVWLNPKEAKKYNIVDKIIG